MSSEQEPLLPSTHLAEQVELPTWRHRLAEALESTVVHKLIIALVRPFLARHVPFPPPLTSSSLSL